MASRSGTGRDRASTPGGRGAGTTRPAQARRPRTGRSGKKNTGTGPQITTRAVLLLSVVLLLIASYTASFRAWWTARQDVTATQAERAALKDQIEDLKSEKKRFDDPAYIKQQARDRFGWVMPGEVGYRVIGADGSVRGDVPALDSSLGETKKQWYDRLASSVVKAGSGPEDRAEEPATESPKNNDEPLEPKPADQ